MAIVAVASPAQGGSSRDVNASAAAVGPPSSNQSLKSALARSVTGTLAFYLCASCALEIAAVPRRSG